jgi:hypothetical protein
MLASPPERPLLHGFDQRRGASRRVTLRELPIPRVLAN